MIRLSVKLIFEAGTFYISPELPILSESGISWISQAVLYIIFHEILQKRSLPIPKSCHLFDRVVKYLIPLVLSFWRPIIRFTWFWCQMNLERHDTYAKWQYLKCDICTPNDDFCRNIEISRFVNHGWSFSMYSHITESVTKSLTRYMSRLPSVQFYEKIDQINQSFHTFCVKNSVTEASCYSFLWIYFLKMFGSRQRPSSVKVVLQWK